MAREAPLPARSRVSADSVSCSLILHVSNSWIDKTRAHASRDDHEQGNGASSRGGPERQGKGLGTGLIGTHPVPSPQSQVPTAPSSPSAPSSSASSEPNPRRRDARRRPRRRPSRASPSASP